MKYYFCLFIVCGIFNCGVRCRNVNSSKNTNTIYLKNLSQTQYTINDTAIELTDKGIVSSIKYSLLDSARLENEQCKVFFIAIPGFQQLMPDTLREKTILAIGKKISGCEIHVVESREVYSALITSDLRGKEGIRISELIENSWRYDYILK